MQYYYRDVVENDGRSYICILDHVSAAETEPNIGGSWETYWELMADSGTSGTSGTSGVGGSAGTSGISGSSGTSGISGSSGTSDNSSSLPLIGGTLTGDLNLGVAGTGVNQTIYASLGTELCPAMTQALWTEGAGWTITDLTGIATRVASAVTTLEPTTPIVPDITKRYKRVFTISSWTAGTITSTFGGVTSTPYSGDQVVSTYIDPYKTGNLIFTPSADFAGVVSLVSVKELTKGILTVEGDIHHYDSRGHYNRLGHMTRHINEMSADTLLDKSRSSLSCTGGVLTYTLFAVFGNGTFNFNGIPYPIEADEVSIALTAGTDAAPQVNYVNFHLVGNTPTLRVSTTYPTDVHIDVATWLVGAVSGSSYTIYSYDRNRYEVDTFVKRVLERFEKSGTLYSSGGVPTVAQTTLSIASGCEFFNGIFEMTSANTVTLAGFTIIKNNAFAAATSIAETLFYSNGTAVGNHFFANVVWGIVPTTTTVGGTVATTVKLYAILQTKPTVEYSLAQARQDLYEATNYFPSNLAVKNVFVPICRTIVSEDNPTQFQTFDTGLYHKDVRGKITSGGGAATQTDISGLVPKTTTITATTPLLIDSTTSADLSADRTISIPAASASVNGYMGTAYAAKLDGLATTTGSSGTSGLSGSSGTSGLTGSSGTSGTNGTHGTSGSSGSSGSSGTSGLDGSSGTSGIAGSSGTSGISGSSGTSGNGSSGTSGISGSSGTSGNGTSGTSGIGGSSGTSGVSGSSGTSGVDGTSGTSGDGTSGTSGVGGTSGTSGVGGSSGTSGTSPTNTKATGAEINAVTDDTKYTTPKAIGDSKVKMWRTIPAADYTAHPASSSTLTMSVDMTASVLVGMSLRYTIGGVEYFGQVQAVAAELLTVRGAPLGEDVSDLQYGGGEVIQMVIFIPGLYEDASGGGLVASDLYSNILWRKPKSYCVYYSMWSKVHDSGGTHGKASVLINATELNTSAGGLTLAANATLYQTAVDIATAAYDINDGEAIEITSTKGTTGDASDLTATLIFITP